MELKFSPETAREWNKSLGKSRELASYEDIHEFLTICTRGNSDTSDAADAKARVKSCPSVNSVSVPTCVNCAGSHNLAVKTFAQSRSRNVMRWLRRNKCVSIICGRITIQNARADRDVFIVVASHSSLHLEAATLPMPVNQAPKIDNSSRTVSIASPAAIANVQSASRK